MFSSDGVVPLDLLIKSSFKFCATFQDKVEAVEDFQSLNVNARKLALYVITTRVGANRSTLLSPYGRRLAAAKPS